MPTLVVKLGSSVVAEATGDLRPGVLERVCDEVAALHGEGVDVVIVTSGAIARGMRLLELPIRPRAIEDLQAASAVGQGKLYRGLRRAAARPRSDLRAGAAHVLRHERAHPLRQRAAHAAQAARLADRAGHQRERHDDHRPGLLRRQRLPRRPGGGADRRRPARPADRHRRPLHRRSAPRPGRDAGRPRSTDPEALGVLEIGHETSPLGSGGMRSKVVAADMATSAGISDRDRVRPRAGRARASAWAGEATGTRFAPRPSRQSSFKLWLQVREARPGHAVRRRGRRAGAARGRDVAAAGRHRRGARALRRRRRGRRPRRATAAIGKGICNYSAAELRRVIGPQVRRGARGAAARDRGSGPPGLLRAGLDFSRHGRRHPQRHRDLPRRARGVARARDDDRPRDEGRRAAARSPTRSRRAPTRSSRPTRATSRPGASPGSRAR